MAVLVGGFTSNANAQKKDTGVDQTITEYDQAVSKCETLYNTMSNQAKVSDATQKKYDNLMRKATYYKDSLRGEKMTSDQQKRYNVVNKRFDKLPKPKNS